METLNSKAIIAQIEERLPQVPPEKLLYLLGYVTHVVDTRLVAADEADEILPLLAATEQLLAEDWNSPEDEAAWAYLADIKENWEPTPVQEEEYARLAQQG